ncbi:MAG: hypothetical protein A2900_05660 [Candidatus Chisholmbacteria bacterium RIFCSPLOWO2_01_FULL_50_28]|nr:MAG: hypothetical protein A2900_05660 [Candidatus Chisholmbacteria bacterium RIFCSPLOWO2_01_FULL_50_28]
MRKRRYWRSLLWQIPLVMLGVYWIYGLWISLVPKITLSIDEVPWILDAQFYTHRRNNNWERFSLPKDFKYLRWETQKRRLLDQPQFGKYLIGFLLQSTGRKMVDEETSTRLYAIVHTDVLPTGKTLEEAAIILGSEVTDAILLIRYASVAAGLLAILFLAWIATNITRDWKIGFSIAVFSAWHPLIRNTFGIATADAFFVLFLLISGTALVATLHQLPRLSNSRIFLSSFVLGMLIACTTSIKLPGVFLLFFPWLYFSLLCLTHPSTISKQQWKRFLFFCAGYTLSFLATFFFLEPEIWADPIRGTGALFGSRILQQELFYRAFGQFSFLEMPLYILTVFISISKYRIVQSLLTLLLLFGWYSLLRRAKNDPQSHSLLSLSIFWIVVNIAYARVKLPGFERYLIPTLLILILVTSVGLKQATTWITNTLQSNAHKYKTQKA